MPLWKVEIAGVSCRYVEAKVHSQAIARVRDSIIKTLELKASRADSQLEQAYTGANESQRARLIASLDCMAPTKPHASLRKQVERLQAQLDEREAWMTRTQAHTPPASPERMRRVARIVQDADIEVRKRKSGLIKQAMAED